MWRTIISELIGRTRTVFRTIYPWSNQVARDLTQVDYRFYDKARRGTAEGLEISGLLLKPVHSKIASWVMGRAPTIETGTPAGDELSRWVRLNLADILRGYEDSIALGDAYLVVNPDLSLTVLPPHVVERVADANNFSITVGWRITERWDHPTNPGQYQIIEDVYTATERVRTIRNSGGVVVSAERYPNLLGMVPVVKISNNVGTNELYGRPETEALTHMLHEYGEVLSAALFGNKRLGRSTPTIEFKDVRALDKFWEINAQRETRTLPDGTTETYETIPFSSDDVMAVVGNFKYAQPGSFAGDTQILLELLYLIFLEHTELPEFVLGSAVSSSKASTDTQMPVFVRFIEKKRTMAGEWMRHLLMIVQGYLVLLSRLPAVDADELQIIWEDLTNSDGQLTLATIQWAVAEGLMDDETALTLAPVDVDDPKMVIEKARKERKERDAARLEMDYQALLAQAQGDTDGEDVESVESAAA